MFTGIVEQVGAVISTEALPTHRSLELKGEGLDELEVGASLAVNGVCLTATRVDGSTVTVEVIPETLAKTNLGSLDVGSPVNLERPMPVSGRFDGHIVQGHVDGIGTVTKLSLDEAGTVMTIEPPDGLMQFIIEKGSITVDGVSLTVSGLTEDAFEVSLIPHTLEVTTLGLRKAGDVVNLAKYVERLLESRK